MFFLKDTKQFEELQEKRVRSKMVEKYTWNLFSQGVTKVPLLLKRKEQDKVKTRISPHFHIHACTHAKTHVHSDSCLGSPQAPRRSSFGSELNHHRQYNFKHLCLNKTNKGWGPYFPNPKSTIIAHKLKTLFLMRTGILFKI